MASTRASIPRRSLISASYVLAELLDLGKLGEANLPGRTHARIGWGRGRENLMATLAASRRMGGGREGARSPEPSKPRQNSEAAERTSP